MVIPQRSAESLTTYDLASSAAHFVAWFDDRSDQANKSKHFAASVWFLSSLVYNPHLIKSKNFNVIVVLYGCARRNW